VFDKLDKAGLDSQEARNWAIEFYQAMELTKEADQWVTADCVPVNDWRKYLAGGWANHWRKRLKEIQEEEDVEY
jgi:hypothetical protein